MTKTFEIGKTYATRSLCDYECIFSFTVVARTAKTITIESNAWGTVKRGIRLYDDVEICKPLGSYSMAPTIHADRAGEIY
jgi:hypothetical protein